MSNTYCHDVAVRSHRRGWRKISESTMEVRRISDDGHVSRLVSWLFIMGSICNKYTVLRASG